MLPRAPSLTATVQVMDFGLKAGNNKGDKVIPQEYFLFSLDKMGALLTYV